MLNGYIFICTLNKNKAKKKNAKKRKSHLEKKTKFFFLLLLIITLLYELASKQLASIALKINLLWYFFFLNSIIYRNVFFYIYFKMFRLIFFFQIFFLSLLFFIFDPTPKFRNKDPILLKKK